MQFRPASGTNIGTGLEKKILQPFIYDVINRNEKLRRPYLILTITDGKPEPETPDTLKNAIFKCGQELANRGLPQDCKFGCYLLLFLICVSGNYLLIIIAAVMFLISQVGNSSDADQFLDSLADDPVIEKVLFRTAGKFLPATSYTT